MTWLVDWIARAALIPRRVHHRTLLRLVVNKGEGLSTARRLISEIVLTQGAVAKSEAVIVLFVDEVWIAQTLADEIANRGLLEVDQQCAAAPVRELVRVPQCLRDLNDKVGAALAVGPNSPRRPHRMNFDASENARRLTDLPRSRPSEQIRVRRILRPRRDPDRSASRGRVPHFGSRCRRPRGTVGVENSRSSRASRKSLSGFRAERGGSQTRLSGERLRTPDG